MAIISKQNVIRKTVLQLHQRRRAWRNDRASDLRSRSPEFDGRPGRGCVTTLGKLFTTVCLDADSRRYYMVSLNWLPLTLPEEDRATGSLTCAKMSENWTCGSGDNARGHTKQTHQQTDALIAKLSYPTAVGRSN